MIAGASARASRLTSGSEFVRNKRSVTRSPQQGEWGLLLKPHARFERSSDREAERSYSLLLPCRCRGRCFRSRGRRRRRRSHFGSCRAGLRPRAGRPFSPSRRPFSSSRGARLGCRSLANCYADPVAAPVANRYADPVAAPVSNYHATRAPPRTINHNPGTATAAQARLPWMAVEIRPAVDRIHEGEIFDRRSRGRRP
jgi:hypothetical protein